MPKTSGKSRGWCYTQFRVIKGTRYSDKEWELILAKIKEIDCAWNVAQVENTKSLGIHLQGAIWFATPRTLNGVKKRFPTNNVHLEPAGGTPEESEIYCTKHESRATGKDYVAFMTGTRPKQGARADIAELMTYSACHTDAECWLEYPGLMPRAYRAVQARRAAMVQKQRRMPHVTVFYGKTETGKSHACHAKAAGEGEDAYYVMPTTVRGGIPWIDGYMGEEKVVMEDFEGEIPYRSMLRMLDKYPHKMQTKGGFVEFSPKHVLISSNLHPEKWYPKKTYMGGPLHRRLEGKFGRIIHLTKVWKEEEKEERVPVYEDGELVVSLSDIK